MTTSNPGSVNQQPLYGCTSCYEECTYPADHLHVHDSECWCDLCWDARRDDFPDQPDWGDLEPYTPALQAECEKLRQQVETFQGLKPAMPPRPPTGEGLPRYGLRWNGPSQPLSVPMDDGYWTPWHLAQGECEKLREDAEATRKSVKLLNYLFARNIIAMQSAVIEWEKGKGAAAGTQWIWNNLFGPGQIPDEDETDAQAYFDREIEPLDAAMQGGKP